MLYRGIPTSYILVISFIVIVVGVTIYIVTFAAVQDLIVAIKLTEVAIMNS